MNYYGQFNNQFPPPVYYPPDFVTYEEKKKIRHNYNVIGAVLLILFVLTMTICTVSYLLFCPDPVYDENGFPIYGLADMIIGGGFPAVIAICVFFGYCFASRYNPKELFRMNSPDKGQIFRYVLIVLGCQQASLVCTIIISSVLNSMGLEVGGLNYVLEHKPSVYAFDIFSAVILAPIGEELIYRGIVLRCSAKVSQRFAIFFSAFIFGIMHGNPYQFVLGFLIGIPMAIITIKTGSIIPAIICHMTNNAVASVPMIVEYFNEEASTAVNLIMLPIFLIIGIIMLASEISSGRMKLPRYTDFHKKRTLPILVTSWSIITVMIFYGLELITSVGPIEENPLPPEMNTETASIALFMSDNPETQLCPNCRKGVL